MKSVTAALAALVTALLLAAPTQGAAGASPGPDVVDSAQASAQVSAQVSAQAAPRTKYARAAQRAVNDIRVAKGRKETDFSGSRCLRRAARAYARRSAKAKGMVPHDLKAVARRCEVTGLKEALGIGFRSGRELVDAWMAVGNAEARAVLSRRSRIGAVEAAKDGEGTWYAIMLVAKG